MRRIAAAFLSVLFFAACGESSFEPSGADSAVPGPSFTSHLADADLCDGISPCDGSADGNGGTPGFYWLPSLMSNPGDVGDYFAGLLPFLSIEIAHVSGAELCDGSEEQPRYCTTEGLDLEEDTSGGLYKTSWKNPKGGPESKPAESVWSVQAWLGLSPDNRRLLGFRHVRLTDNPNVQQPANGPTLDIKNGSNQDIKFTIVADDSGCFGTASDPTGTFVQCLLDLADGATMSLGNTVVQIGSGSQGGLATLTGEACVPNGSYMVADRNDDGFVDIDSDLEPYGSCTQWTFDSPDPDQIQLVNSYLWSCDAIESGDLAMLGSYAVHRANEDGTLALPPPDQLPNCSDLLGTEPTGLEALFDRLAGLFRAKPALATHGGAGGRLTGAGSAYQLLHSVSASPVGPTTLTAAPDVPQTLKVQVTDHDGFGPSEPTSSGDDVDDTTIRFFALNAAGTAKLDATTGADVSLDCGGRLGCSTPNQWEAVFTTGATGLAEVDVTGGTESFKVAALGCDVAVPGDDTPGPGNDPSVADGFAGDGSHCDRDPTDQPTEDGYANGTDEGTDPFIPLAEAEPAIWTNDLPIVFTMQSFLVCSPADDDIEPNGDILFCGFNADGTVASFQMVVEGVLAADFQYRLTVTGPGGSTTIKLDDLSKLTASKGVRATWTVGPDNAALLTFTFDAAKIGWDGVSELVYYWETQKGTQGQQGAGFPDTSAQCSTLSGCP